MPVSRQLYLNVLGLEGNPSAEEIKRAFRDRAKMFHPDVSKEPNAQEKFVLITEAYEYLMDYQSGKIKSRQVFSEEQWAEQQKQQARARAAENARMKYEAFIKSDYYKSATSIADALDFFIIAITAFVLLLISYMAYRENGSSGLISALIIDVLAVSIFYYIARYTDTFSLSKYFHAFSYLFRWKYFHLFFLSIITIWVFFDIGLQTFIPVTTLLLTYISFPLIVFFLMRFFFKRNDVMLAFGIMPAFISFLLIVNYTFTGPVTEETYHYRPYDTEDSGESTLIYLENDVYDEFAGVRLFYYFGEVTSANTITYHTATGLIGLKVVKQHRFYMDYNWD